MAFEQTPQFVGADGTSGYNSIAEGIVALQYLEVTPFRFGGDPSVTDQTETLATTTSDGFDRPVFFGMRERLNDRLQHDRASLGSDDGDLPPDGGEFAELTPPHIPPDVDGIEVNESEHALVA
jgi:hypothetical protein